ncbi:hypothetical protein RBE51_17615 [Pseudomonas taiwanensis]|uniref:hypothetical protein n=1 Tax=Pseudomonas taiwanensis TaxID=470150 RepID=UPI0028DF75AE|nr:hypothetical protein [Pseudomonas taiwanensis]MDT8924628.1 hypothetical protein [Pseudomonas taiwanensis]
MRFLIRSHDDYGPNFSVLFDVLPRVYGAGLKIDIVKDVAELSRRGESEDWRPFFHESSESSIRRALVLPIEWMWQDQEGPEAWHRAWSAFASEALNHGTICGKRLAEDVDLIVLAKKSEHPEIFSEQDPNCSILVDYTHIVPVHKSMEGSVQILTTALASGGQSITKDRNIKKRENADDSFQP